MAQVRNKVTVLNRAALSLALLYSSTDSHKLDCQGWCL